MCGDCDAPRGAELDSGRRAGTANGSVVEPIDAAIRHAKTYYVLGMVEQGDLRAPKRAGPPWHTPRNC